MKITDNEAALIENIALNDYQDGAAPSDRNQVWCDSLDCGPNEIPLTSIPGITSSLVKKGLVRTNGETISLTNAGVTAFNELAYIENNSK